MLIDDTVIFKTSRWDMEQTLALFIETTVALHIAYNLTVIMLFYYFIYFISNTPVYIGMLMMTFCFISSTKTNEVL